MSGERLSARDLSRRRRREYRRPVCCGPFKHDYLGRTALNSVLDMADSQSGQDGDCAGVGREEAEQLLSRAMHESHRGDLRDPDRIAWSVLYYHGSGCELQYGGFRQRQRGADSWNGGDRPTGTEAADLQTVLETVVLPQLTGRPSRVRARLLGQSGQSDRSLDDADMVEVTGNYDSDGDYFSLTIAWGRIRLAGTADRRTTIRRLLSPFSRRARTAERIAAAVGRSLLCGGKAVEL